MFKLQCYNVWGVKKGMIPFFKNEDMELYEIIESSSRYNVYGEAEVEYELVGVYPCDFQPMSPRDVYKEFGKVLQDTYKIYCNIDVPVTDTMIIKLKGKPETYHIIGSPEFNTRLLKHIKMEVQKTRKPIQLK